MLAIAYGEDWIARDGHGAGWVGDINGEILSRLDAVGGELRECAARV